MIKRLALFAAQRCVLAVLVVLLVSFMTYMVVDVTTDANEAIAGEWVVISHGVETSALSGYREWLFHAIQGSFGESLLWNRSVMSVIEQHLATTLWLTSAALVGALLFSTMLVMTSYLLSNALFSRVLIMVCMVFHALPAFTLGLILIWIFSYKLDWLPASGTLDWHSFILPVLALAFALTPRLVLVMDVTLKQVLSAGFVLQLRSCGVHGWRLWVDHIVVNLLPALLSVVSIQAVHLLTGAVVTESVFSMNGLGRLTLESVVSGDVNMIVALAVLFAVAAVSVDLVVNLLIFAISPHAETRGNLLP